MGWVSRSEHSTTSKLLTMEQIGIPPSARELLWKPRGLILVTGPTGSGKSTTLASMVNYINEARDGHIITIEDPIEYTHAHKNCLITQREVGVDTHSIVAQRFHSSLPIRFTCATDIRPNRNKQTNRNTFRIRPASI